MKKHIFLLGLLYCHLALGQKVGINTDNPSVILEIQKNTHKEDPTSDAIIIPRVSNLDWKGGTIGQLVFLEKEPNAQDEHLRGFYWWNGQSWTPFYSTVQASINRTITYVKTKPALELIGIPSQEGFYSQLTSYLIRTLLFPEITEDTTPIQTATPEDFTIKNGRLVVNKAGYYNLTASINLVKRSVNGGANIRDAYDLNVIVNNRSVLQSSQSIPNGIDVGANLVASGAIELKAGDEIYLTIHRRYRGSQASRPRNTARVLLDDNANNNITLQYIGNIEQGN